MEAGGDVPSASTSCMIRLENYVSYDEAAGVCSIVSLLGSNRRGMIGTVTRTSKGDREGL